MLPPAISRTTPSLEPPQCAMSSAIGVPIGASMFCGFLTPPPVTVDRATSGSRSARKRCTA
jgi:hypothetical protein